MSVCTDPSTDLTHIQEVSDWILKAKLPLSLAAFKGKLKELKDLAANLPDSTAILDEAEPQLDSARKLLKEAQDARWALTLLLMIINTVFSSSYLKLWLSRDCKQTIHKGMFRLNRRFFIK